MYMYMLTETTYECSSETVLSNHRHFTAAEFKTICDGGIRQIQRLRNSGELNGDFLYLLEQWLVEHYNFQRPHITAEYNCEEIAEEVTNEQKNYTEQ